MRALLSTLMPLLVLGVVLASAHGEEPKPRKKKVKLDRTFYEYRIVPIVQSICTECHADPTRTLGRHRLKPPPGTELTAKHVKQNFKTVSKLIRAGKPNRSPWLLKPLGPHQGGLEHGGGQRIVAGSLEHEAMLAFVNGAKHKGRAEPKPEPPPPPPIPVHELRGQVLVEFAPEAFELVGDLTAVDDADGVPVLRAGSAGGSAALHLVAHEDQLVGLELLVRGPGQGLGWRLDDEPWRAIADVGGGEHRVGGAVVVDGLGPVRAPTGSLRVTDARLEMRGDAQAPAAWLASAKPAFRYLEARVSLPPEGRQRQDALLLFGMADVDDGYFVGLLDAGRVLAAGRLERGRPVAYASARVPAAVGGALRRLGVRRTAEGAHGVLDGDALVFIRIDDAVDRRPFGLLTHGTVTVDGLTATGDGQTEAVYDARFETRPAVRIPAGRHVIHLALPAGAPAVRTLTLSRPLPGGRGD